MYGITENFQSICGDFYEIVLDDFFNLVYYMDGFGIGTDNDQIKLLKRIHNWLKTNETALIYICTTWYWSKITGQVMTINNVTRKYDIDFHHNRIIATSSNKHNDQIN